MTEYRATCGSCGRDVTAVVCDECPACGARLLFVGVEEVPADD